MLTAGTFFRHGLGVEITRRGFRRLQSYQHHAGFRSHWTSTLENHVQSYVSSCTDPFVNLSIEHYLLQSTPPESTVLLFYTNSPSIVIGRNQNPWYETNLSGIQPLLRDGSLKLVRRRSGGGTVYHDQGNINWTVICPSKRFTRDAHAAMVVRALRSPRCGVMRARINERHDIVLDQGTQRRGDGSTSSEYETPWTNREDGALRPLKCSGSAFKITRHRALHHGTCLLNTENLVKMGTLLSSPGKPYIQAKGVESVSSPVGNTGLLHSSFMAAVRIQYERLYNQGRPVAHVPVSKEEAMTAELIRKGYAELTSPSWLYGQTPRFSFTARASEVPELIDFAPLTVHVETEKGSIKRLAVWRGEDAAALDEHGSLQPHEYDMTGEWAMYNGSWDWAEKLTWLDHSRSPERAQSLSQRLSAWLQNVFPPIKTSVRS